MIGYNETILSDNEVEIITKKANTLGVNAFDMIVSEYEAKSLTVLPKLMKDSYKCTECYRDKENEVNEVKFKRKQDVTVNDTIWTVNEIVEAHCVVNKSDLKNMLEFGNKIGAYLTSGTVEVDVTMSSDNGDTIEASYMYNFGVTEDITIDECDTLDADKIVNMWLYKENMKYEEGGMYCLTFIGYSDVVVEFRVE